MFLVNIKALSVIYNIWVHLYIYTTHSLTIRILYLDQPTKKWLTEVRGHNFLPCNFSINPLKNYRISKKNNWKIIQGINAHFTKIKINESNGNGICSWGLPSLFMFTSIVLLNMYYVYMVNSLNTNYISLIWIPPPPSPTKPQGKRKGGWGHTKGWKGLAPLTTKDIS